MKTSFRQGLVADEPNTETRCALRARDRVLEAACELFAAAGYHGTHLREICQRAGTNVAGVCYHFDSKEGLFEAVSMEAGRRLSDQAEGFAASRHVPPEQRLLQLVESLLKRLSVRHAWIAKLLARELVDSGCATHNYASSGLERDLILLQAVMRDLLGTKTNSEAVRCHALSVIGECVFYSLAEENPRHPLTQIAVSSPTRLRLAEFITQRVLAALPLEAAKLEISNP
jgi:AcrR family transcriptional regulator